MSVKIAHHFIDVRCGVKMNIIILKNGQMSRNAVIKSLSKYFIGTIFFNY